LPGWRGYPGYSRQEAIILLGCIGDDFTGSSDLGNVLARVGMRTVQYTGVPQSHADSSIEAGIVALKSRTIPAAEAVTQSLKALDWLRKQGCRQILFKYCSTFDSTPDGNIGPVADALADALAAQRVVVCPAYPTLNRSIYQGHLFVGDHLLSQSGMENHPLTPMTEADLRVWLARQSVSTVGHVAAGTVLMGRAAVRDALVAPGMGRLVVVDCITDVDLIEIGAAVAGMPLVTGGSGIGLGLATVFRDAGMLARTTTQWAPVTGPAVVLSGSCSIATRGQVRHHKERCENLEVLADDIMTGVMTPSRATEWALSQGGDMPLIYSSADPDIVRAAQQRHGRHEVASAVEAFMGQTAQRLVDAGVKRIVVAGGETSGAVTEALGVEALEFGPEIDPGVPAMRVVGRPLALALKSGNFGKPDFFTRAAQTLAGL
jgi:uncharacterized protein YgbK (DUF1537 family)